MRRIEKLCVIIHLFVGIGALGGGAVPIINPSSPMGMSAEALQNSPFTSFLIPGLLLFVVIGLGNLFAALSFFRQWELRPFISGFFAFALVMWLAIQCAMLQAVAALHVIFFCIGAAQGILAICLMFMSYNTYERGFTEPAKYLNNR